MKWVPALLWPSSSRGLAAWGLVFLAVSVLLSLAMLPLTIVQLQVLFGFGSRPIRLDYLVFLWSAVPWWWRHRDPFALLRPRVVARGGDFELRRGRVAGGGFRTIRRDPARAWTRLRLAVRRRSGSRIAGAGAGSRRPTARPVPPEPHRRPGSRSGRRGAGPGAADLLAPPEAAPRPAGSSDRGQRVEDDAAARTRPVARSPVRPTG